MRHRKAGRKLGRDSSHRKAMMRNMVTSLFKHEQVETTDAKAKELRPVAERMITLAKRGDLHARRQALSYIRDKTVTHNLFEQLKDRYLHVQGGYVRIVKKGYRKGDGAPTSIIELIPGEEGKRRGKKKGKAAKPAGAPRPKRKKEPQMKEEGKGKAQERPSKEKAEAVEPSSSKVEEDKE